MSKTEAVKLPPPEGLVDVDWHDELDTGGVDLSAIEAEVEAELNGDSVPSAEGTDVEPLQGELGNPFPPGYGEDLLDE